MVDTTRARIARLATAIALLAMVAIVRDGPATALPPPDPAPPFSGSATSWYQVPHVEPGVQASMSDQWIAQLQAANACDPDCKDFLLLGGLGDSNGNGIPDGEPMYRTAPTGGDPRVEVDCFVQPCYWPQNPKVRFNQCRKYAISCFDLNLPSRPPYWQPSDSGDSTLTVLDRNMYDDGDGNYAVWMWETCPPDDPGTPTSDFCRSDRQHLDHPSVWTTHTITAVYLNSTGLPGCWPTNYSQASESWLWQGGDVHNGVHFGVPSPYNAIHLNELLSGDGSWPPPPIPHMLKVVLPDVTGSGVSFPSTDSDGPDQGVPMGTVMRISPTVALLPTMFKNPNGTVNVYAWAIALTLQMYGAIVGDTSGTSANLGLENLTLEGANRSWADLGLRWDSLDGVPLEDFEFLYKGYGGPSPDEWDKAPDNGKCEDRPVR